MRTFLTNIKKTTLKNFYNSQKDATNSLPLLVNVSVILMRDR